VVRGILNLGTVVPVRGLLGVGVLDLLGAEDLPVLFDGAGGNLLLVNEDLVGLVGVEHEGVGVSELVGLGLDGLLNEVVVAVVVQDDVNPLGGTADIGTEHDVVDGIAVEVDLVESRGDKLDVATTTVEALLVLDGELEDEVLALVGEGGLDLAGNGVEAGVLGGLETKVLLGITKVLAVGELETERKKGKKEKDHEKIEEKEKRRRVEDRTRDKKNPTLKFFL